MSFVQGVWKLDLEACVEAMVRDILGNLPKEHALGALVGSFLGKKQKLRHAVLQCNRVIDIFGLTNVLYACKSVSLRKSFRQSNMWDIR